MRACVCVCTRPDARSRNHKLSPQVGREAAGPKLGPLGHSACAAPLSRPQPVCIPVPFPRPPAPYQLLADPGSLIIPALCPGSAVQRLPSHPLEMSLETLSGARWPPPCGGGRGSSWETGAGSPGTLGGSSRRRLAAGPAPGRAHAVLAARPPARAPTGSTRPLRAGRPEPPPSTPARPTDQIAGRHITPRARLSRSFLPALALAPLPQLRLRRFPSSSSGAGLAEPVLTRSRGRTAQPGLLPARPPSPRARRGCARQEPRRDAPVFSGVLSPRHLLAWEGRCREGEAVERRRGGGAQSRRDPHPTRGEGKEPLPPGSWSQTPGRREVRSPPLNPDKVKFEKTCPCPRGLVAGKYPGMRLGPGPQGQGST